ncbi:MAG: PEP-CTERM sorting domain-containing protein [Planctomycetota bacterium]|nr:MAG: PEP-CTERM sorting domain-containing protein [Planctomycetota bacterium]
MKSLLVLFMVLALASTADAALSFYIDGSPAPDSINVGLVASVTIQIHSDDTANWLGYAGMDISTMSPYGSLGSPHTYKGSDNGPDGGNAGESGNSQAYYETGWMDGFETQTASISGQVVAGIQHTFVYTAPMADGYTRLAIFIPGSGWDWDSDEVDTLYINVPEPMTMSLLALGGALVLIRKRRR